MVTNTSMEIINYAKDIDINYNIKLFLLMVMLAYSLFFIWFSFKYDKDKHYITFIKIFLIRIPMMVFVFFFPLFSFLLLRSASWEIIYGFMVTFYSYSFIILLIAFKVGMFEFITETWDIKTTPKSMKIKSKW